MNRKYTVFLFTLSILACGVQAALPTAAPRTAPVKSRVISQKTAQPTEDAKQMLVCNSGGLNFRADAGQGAELVMVNPIPDGETVTLTGKEKTPSLVDWYEIVYNGRVGWISSKYVCSIR